MSSERPWLAHYPAGVPAEIDLDEFASINDIFDSAVKKYRDKTAFINMGKSITYGDLERLSAVPITSCKSPTAKPLRANCSRSGSMLR